MKQFTRTFRTLVAVVTLALLVTPVARADGGVGGWPPPTKIGGAVLSGR